MVQLLVVKNRRWERGGRKRGKGKRGVTQTLLEAIRIVKYRIL